MPATSAIDKDTKKTLDLKSFPMLAKKI